MTMRLDIVTNDAGELVRREHARELGAGVVVALYRLARQAQIHDLGEPGVRPPARADPSNHRRVLPPRRDEREHPLRATRRSSSRASCSRDRDGTTKSAAELARDPRVVRRLRALDRARRDAARAARFRGGDQRGDARRERARHSALRRRRSACAPSATPRACAASRWSGSRSSSAIVRNYATAVVVLRGFFDDLAASKYVLPRRIKRIAQNLVNLSAGDTPAFLGVTEVRNANHDAAGRAVNAAILAVAIAREVTGDRATLAQIAMAAMMHDVGRPARARARDGRRAAHLSARRASLGGCGGQAPGRDGRSAHGARPRQRAVDQADGDRVRGALAPSRVVARPRLSRRARARRSTRASSRSRVATTTSSRPSPGSLRRRRTMAIAALANELTDSADRTVLRMLVAALGLFPVGTVVQLSSDEVGEVVPTNRAAVAGRPMRPRVDGSRWRRPGGPRRCRPRASGRVAAHRAGDEHRGVEEGARWRPAARVPRDPSTPSRSAVVPTEPRVPVAAPVASPPARTASLPPRRSSFADPDGAAAAAVEVAARRVPQRLLRPVAPRRYAPRTSRRPARPRRPSRKRWDG